MTQSSLDHRQEHRGAETKQVDTGDQGTGRGRKREEQREAEDGKQRKKGEEEQKRRVHDMEQEETAGELAKELADKNKYLVEQKGLFPHKMRSTAPLGVHGDFGVVERAFETR